MLQLKFTPCPPPVLQGLALWVRKAPPEPRLPHETSPHTPGPAHSQNRDTLSPARWPGSHPPSRSLTSSPGCTFIWTCWSVWKQEARERAAGADPAAPRMGTHERWAPEPGQSRPSHPGPDPRPSHLRPLPRPFGWRFYRILPLSRLPLGANEGFFA